jgi:hypothetical protein
MKKSMLLVAILMSCALYAQEFTSFEEPELFSGLYTDTGDPNVAHDLMNNPDEPIVNFTTAGGEMGFMASYVPYDTPGDGLTDGDEVGVTDSPPSGDHPFPDGNQGYQVSDVDGNYILEFEPIVTTSTGPGMYIDYFIAETGYEGDGTVNESGSDRLRIYVRHLEENDEYDILDTTGSNINDLGIEGEWINGYVELPAFNSDPLTFQLVIEVRCNSSSETFYFDKVEFYGYLGIESHNEDVFSIVPNPAKGNHIKILSNNSAEKEITVYDILGKQIMYSIIESTLDISGLNNGIYLVQIKQSDRIETKKLVIH